MIKGTDEQTLQVALNGFVVCQCCGWCQNQKLGAPGVFVLGVDRPRFCHYPFDPSPVLVCQMISVARPRIESVRVE